MFIVKAMRPNLVPPEHYTVFQCDYYEVQPSRTNGANSSGKPYIAPQMDVGLWAKGLTMLDDHIASLEVGFGENQFCTVYVMNDRGKTIDTIQARE
jgi:hypothetical protein